jgi:hypothetical protein
MAACGNQYWLTERTASNIYRLLPDFRAVTRRSSRTRVSSSERVERATEAAPITRNDDLELKVDRVPDD